MPRVVAQTYRRSRRTQTDLLNVQKILGYFLILINVNQLPSLDAVFLFYSSVQLTRSSSSLFTLVFMILVSFLFLYCLLKLITCRSNKILGFIKRFARDFKLSRCSKVLYCTLVRSILKYGFVVQNPHLMIYCQQIEYVQHQFLSFVRFKLNIILQPHDCDLVFLHFNLLSLAVLPKTDSPSFLQHVRFRIFVFLHDPPKRCPVPCNIVCYSPIDYLTNEPLTRHMTQVNLDTSSGASV